MTNDKLREALDRDALGTAIEWADQCAKDTSPTAAKYFRLLTEAARAALAAPVEAEPVAWWIEYGPTSAAFTQGSKRPAPHVPDWQPLYAHPAEQGKDAEDAAQDALAEILQWCDAYPLDIFPEPDFKRAAEVLKAAGMTIDSISASAGRHILSGISRIARNAKPAKVTT